MDAYDPLTARLTASSTGKLSQAASAHGGTATFAVELPPQPNFQALEPHDPHSGAPDVVGGVPLLLTAVGVAGVSRSRHWRGLGDSGRGSAAG
jgi:hypothetical protein